MPPSFVCLTPNPAVDRLLHLGAPLAPQRLNRVARVEEGAGGKGTNVARVLSALGANAAAAGFLGGHNGSKYRSLLAADGLEGIFVDVSGDTRECQIVLDGTGHPTEINDPGPVVDYDDWQRLVERLPAAQLIVSGSLPPGIAPREFAGFLQHATAITGTRPVVDTSGPFLTAAIAARVALVKPNLAELRASAGPTVDPFAYAAEVSRETGVEVLLTLGPDGAMHFGRQHVTRVAAPRVEAVNPVASGDSLLAAFMWARAAGWDVASALRLGVAAGAANAQAGGAARLRREDVFGLLERVGPATDTSVA